MLNSKTIGILGGIGPEATAYFYKKLIKQIQQNFNIQSNNDYPHIIINSIPLPDMIDEEIQKNIPESIIKGLNELNSLHTNFNVIICNSAYVFYNEFISKTKDNIINLEFVVKKTLTKQQVKNYALIGTPLTTKYLYNFPGLNKLIVSDKEQMILNDIIIRFNQGKTTYNDKLFIKNIIEKLRHKGAETVVLACTELELLGLEFSHTIKPLELLGDEVLNRLKGD